MKTLIPIITLLIFLTSCTNQNEEIKEVETKTENIETTSSSNEEVVLSEEKSEEKDEIVEEEKEEESVEEEKEGESEKIDLGNGYTKDDNFVYYNGEKQENLDINTFKYIGCNLSLSNGKLYHFGENRNEFKEIEKLVNLNDIKFKRILVYGSGQRLDKCIIGDKNSLILFEEKQKDLNITIRSRFDYNTFIDSNECFNSGLGSIICGYSKDKNNIYYDYQLVKGADIKTFEEIKYKNKGYGSNHYAKDKNYFYKNGKKIEGSNSGTFKFIIKDENLNGEYKSLAIDKNLIYMIDSSDLETYKLNDYYSFEYIGKNKYHMFFKDKNSIYIDGKILGPNLGIELKFIGDDYLILNNKLFTSYGKEIDLKGNKLDFDNIKIYNGQYQKKYIYDKNGLYKIVHSYLEKIKSDLNIDYESFKNIGYYFMDKNNIYSGKIDNLKLYKELTNRDKENIDFILGNEYLKDYSLIDLLDIKDDIDFKTLEIIDNNFVKDKNNVYQIRDAGESTSDKFIKLDGVDVDSFESGVGVFGKDKNKIYNYYVNIIDEPDVETFTYKNKIYKDKDNIYFYIRTASYQDYRRDLDREEFFKIDRVDYESYEIVNDFSQNEDMGIMILGKDKNNYFFNGKMIIGTDSSKELIKIGDQGSFYFNNGVIFDISHYWGTIKNHTIIKNGYNKSNIDGIKVLPLDDCGPSSLGIFFPGDELPKSECDFSN